MYTIGGTDRDACGTEVVYSAVERLRDPQPSTWPAGWWDDAGVPDLAVARKKHNAVILLDGSILVVGGQSASGGCAGVLDVELLKPVEAFGTDPTQWIPMNQHQIQRNEHAVAALLPDGSVWVAGGKDLHQAYHSFEIFRPPYLQQGRVPEVLSVGTSSVWTTGGSAQLVNVRCYDVSSPAKACLVKLSSVTHGFDMGQRSVELQATQPTQLPDGSWDIIVSMPANGMIAPPGHYWLSVRDTVGRPSPGRLIRIRNP